MFFTGAFTLENNLSIMYMYKGVIIMMFNTILCFIMAMSEFIRGK